MYQSGDHSYEHLELFNVINLTSEYLILEKIEDKYCFDYSNGKKLSKKECKEKAKECE
jgi:hypothetical protein